MILQPTYITNDVIYNFTQRQSSSSSNDNKQIKLWLKDHWCIKHSLSLIFACYCLMLFYILYTNIIVLINNTNQISYNYIYILLSSIIYILMIIFIPCVISYKYDHNIQKQIYFNIYFIINSIIGIIGLLLIFVLNHNKNILFYTLKLILIFSIFNIILSLIVKLLKYIQYYLPSTLNDLFNYYLF